MSVPTLEAAHGARRDEGAKFHGLIGRDGDRDRFHGGSGVVFHESKILGGGAPWGDLVDGLAIGLHPSLNILDLGQNVVNAELVIQRLSISLSHFLGVEQT